MNIIRKSSLLFCFANFILFASIHSQTTLTLDSCQSLAKANYPLIKQHKLIDAITPFNIDNALKGKLPQILFAGQATYQSEVTTIPIDIPNLDIPSPAKDQYKLYGEISQSINELYTTKDRIAYIESNADVENRKTEVELYKLRERVNQIYFTILLLEKQIDQTTLLKKDIQNGIDKVRAQIKNGIAIRSQASLLEAELLKTNQKTSELQTTRNGYLATLQLFIGRPVPESTTFIQPKPPAQVAGLHRPELELYTQQQKTIDLQRKLLANENLPRLSAFLQTGIGKPGLNLLSNDFDFYYIGGVRFAWNLSGKYAYRNNLEVLTINQQLVDVQKEVFEFNTNQMIIQQSADIKRLQQLIATDYEIISLREDVTSTSKTQLENGTATANDYLLAINAVDQARENLAIHQIQLLQAQYNLTITIGR